MFATFWVGAFAFYRDGMSENNRFYQQKMEALRTSRRRHRPLGGQLREILVVVAECERRWALEERIERQLGRGQ